MQGMNTLPGRLVVCAPAELPSLFTDDEYGNCALCGGRVRFRPHRPAVRSLVCLVCYVVNADDGDVVELTSESETELTALGILPRDAPKC